MKKNMKVAGAVILVIVIAAGVWLGGYYSRKSNDNIPSQALIVTYAQEKGEEFASGKLEGYTRSQLMQVWGEPDGSLAGFFGDIWETEDQMQIVVYYRGTSQDGIVEHVTVSEK